MPALFDLLEKEKHAAVRAVLGHFIFVYIHPYMDGNGRIGRFLMNAMFASGGYPWVVIPFARRSDYMNALNAASGGNDFAPFANSVAQILAEQSHLSYRPDQPKGKRSEFNKFLKMVPDTPAPKGDGR